MGPAQPGSLAESGEKDFPSGHRLGLTLPEQFPSCPLKTSSFCLAAQGTSEEGESKEQVGTMAAKSESLLRSWKGQFPMVSVDYADQQSKC